MPVNLNEYDALVTRTCSHIKSSAGRLQHDMAKADDNRTFARDLTLAGMMLARLYEMLGYDMRFAVNDVEVRLKWPMITGTPAPTGPVTSTAKLHE
jgi:hypothetical protein